MNSDKSRRGLVFYRWLISYLSVLVVPLLAGVFFYFGAGSIVNVEVRNANEHVVAEIGRTIDDALRTAERLSWQIGEHPRVQSVLNTTYPLADHHYYRFYSIYREFAVYRFANVHVTSFYVYLRNLNAVMAPEGFRSAAIHHSQFHDLPDFSYEQWIDLIEQYHRRRFVVLPYIDTFGRRNQRVAMLHSLPELTQSGAPGTLVVLLDMDVFLNAVQRNRLTDEGFSVVLDAEANTVASTRPIAINAAQRRRITESDRFVDDIDGEPFVFQVYRSQVTDWFYLAAIPESVYIARRTLLVQIAVAALVFCVVLGSVTAYYQSVLRYNPIRRLIAVMGGEKKLVSNRATLDEFGFIEQSLVATLSENQELASKVNRQTAEVRSYLLSQLCHGTITWSDTLRAELRNLGVQVDADRFGLFIVTVEDSESFFPGKSAQQKAELARVVISNVFEELFSAIRRVVTFELDNQAAFLLAWNPEYTGDEHLGDPSVSEFTAVARKAIQFVTAHYHLVLTVCAGARKGNIDELPAMYREARASMEYRLVRGTGEVIVYKHIDSHKRSFEYPLEMEQQLITSVRCGDTATALLILDKVYQANFERHNISIDMARCLIFDLVNTMIKTVAAVIPEENGVFWDDLKPIRRLLACETSEAIRTAMTDIITTVCAFVNTNKRSHNDRLKQRILTYLHDNYADPNLCTAGIAFGLTMNAAYLTRFFKEQTGFGIADYLARYRVARAKDALLTSAISVRAIAEEVGFGNAGSLIRSFKRYEGLTPQQFRSLSVAVAQ